jgi:hypothetical protein
MATYLCDAIARHVPQAREEVFGSVQGMGLKKALVKLGFEVKEVPAGPQVCAIRYRAMHCDRVSCCVFLPSLIVPLL